LTQFSLKKRDNSKHWKKKGMRQSEKEALMPLDIKIIEIQTLASLGDHSYILTSKNTKKDFAL